MASTGIAVFEGQRKGTVSTHCHQVSAQIMQIPPVMQLARLNEIALLADVCFSMGDKDVAVSFISQVSCRKNAI